MFDRLVVCWLARTRCLPDSRSQSVQWRIIEHTLICIRKMIYHREFDVICLYWKLAINYIFHDIVQIVRDKETKMVVPSHKVLRLIHDDFHVRVLDPGGNDDEARHRRYEIKLKKSVYPCYGYWRCLEKDVRVYDLRM